MQLVISTAFLSVLYPQTNLDILVIIVVHRAKIWVKLLVIPSTLYIISSGTMRDIQQGGSILARTGSIVLWPVCMMSSVIGSYRQVLVSSQSIASICIVLGLSGTSKTTQDGYPTPGARLFIWQLFTIWYVHYKSCRIKLSFMSRCVWLVNFSQLRVSSTPVPLLSQ